MPSIEGGCSGRDELRAWQLRSLNIFQYNLIQGQSKGQRKCTKTSGPSAVDYVHRYRGGCVHRVEVDGCALLESHRSQDVCE